MLVKASEQELGVTKQTSLSNILLVDNNIDNIDNKQEEEEMKIIVLVI